MNPTTVQKGWGHEEWLHNSELYAFKRLVFRADTEGSFHYHLKKTETWFVISGAFIVTLIDPKTADRVGTAMTAGSIVHIPAGIAHCVRCYEAGVIMEASTQHFEDDTYRFEKGDSQK